MTPEFAGSQYLIEVIYLVASALFILSLKWMSSPATARHGIVAGEIGMVLAIAGTLLQSRHHRLQMDHYRPRPRLGHRGSARYGADDRRSPANRPQPCVRRSVRDARGDCGVLSRHAKQFEVRAVSAFTGSDPRRPDFYRKSHGSGQTAGDPSAASHHLQRPESRQSSFVQSSQSAVQFSRTPSGSERELVPAHRRNMR